MNKKGGGEMSFAANSIDRKKALLQESFVLIERLKKLRALNADPRQVGINPRVFGRERSIVTQRPHKRFKH
ncbi:hypothetical protein ACFL0T_02340 [Candidatus Omnitrophota bacterium]